MTKKQLLAYAKKNYPEGTIHGGYNSGKSNGNYIIKGDLIFGSGDNIYSSNSSGCIYYKSLGFWAKIIKHPEGWKNKLNLNLYYY
jgi:hypothetical protein